MSTMYAALYACLLFWCLHAVGAELAPPQQVTMMALNTNYTLCWDWDQSAAESDAVTFTTQYVAKFKLKSKKKSPNWSMACDNTPHRSCDLSAFNLHYLGIYVLRVRASANGRHSDWVLKEFCPDKDAAVGPPSKVDLSPAGSDLDVFISDPLTSTNSSMKEHLSKLYYHILYWERIVDTQALRTETLSSSANVVTLPNLQAWTWYCVSVQSREDYYNKSSSFTSPQCMQTEGATPWWLIFVYFLGSLVICFLVMLLSLYSSFWCYKTVKSTLCPPDQLPPHLKKYFCASPGSDIPHLLSRDSESELLCDKVTVCPESPVLEIHNPPPEALPVLPADLEPDSSSRHSRQDSSSSRDSGVYSTGGSSSLQQPSSNQSSGQAPFDMEQVKMQDMASGLKSQLLTADEGIVDMCV
ncbi:interferon alpha/beta receptor 1b-like isoform X1 [Micropterus salmoides]|uniref:interferon alpha/beta receptor 1b-like isoform X1 n=1 Tax=Micropterus salmoides TaxID=27706 RepID=UPI0018ED4916|nr:interferon alpha/beta receptor 1b-like isoform X1 [Micropterus salmoides]